MPKKTARTAKRGASKAKPTPGLHVLLGGPTLADKVLEIEEAFGGTNETDGLRARFGRKDSDPDPTTGETTVTVFVEMIPAPDEQESEYEVTHPVAHGSDAAAKVTKHKHTIEVFNAAKIAGHQVGERTSFTADTIEEAINGLALKVGVGGER